MKKLFLLAVCLVCLSLLLPMTALGVEYQMQKQNLIRLHVVGASDGEQDQTVKLLVRDAVLDCIQEGISRCPDAETVKAYLRENLDTIEQVANEILANAGSSNSASVTLCKEEFPKREYDTFSLPSGVYDSLRVTIGEGEGKNWWCVVFPSFCLTASSDGFLDTAAGAGFSQPLRDTLAADTDYEIAFFFLDCIGKLENFFHFGG